MAAATTNTNPSFDLPRGDPDTEVWVLRAPAALDVQALLDGVKLDVDPRSLQSTSSTTNNILSTFTGSDDSEYVLTLGDANESDNLRLLVPDNSNSDDDDDDEKELLVPYERPFQRQINLTSILSRKGEASSSNVQEEFILAPSKDSAPKPAFDQSGNGSVDTMRWAYVPVPQKQGLKRRWAMPGSKITEASPSALYSSSPKRARIDDGGDEAASDRVVSDEDEQTPEEKAPKSSSKKDKKEKKKKEKKSKKTSKK